MEIRLAKANELDEILEIYEKARQYMQENGNGIQWGNTNPTKDMIIEDIEKERLYVGVFDDGRIHCSFAFLAGTDPTYLKIYDGNWLNDKKYMTVHRIASDGVYHGIFEKCMGFCKKKSKNIRIDTHENNATMHHVLKKNGFVRCGIIYLASGDPRVAYQFSEG